MSYFSKGQTSKFCLAGHDKAYVTPHFLSFQASITTVFAPSFCNSVPSRQVHPRPFRAPLRTLPPWIAAPKRDGPSPSYLLGVQNFFPERFALSDAVWKSRSGRDFCQFKRKPKVRCFQKGLI